MLCLREDLLLNLKEDLLLKPPNNSSASFQPQEQHLKEDLKQLHQAPRLPDSNWEILATN